MKLKSGQLEDMPSVHRAVWGEQFGTLYLCSRADAEIGHGKSPVERHHPETVDFIMYGRKKVALPDDWTQDISWRRDDTGFAGFVSHWLEVPWTSRVFGDTLRGETRKVPAEIGMLLSAHLQTGETVNERNFFNLSYNANPKFLPVVITPTGMRYYMYRPSPVMMAQGIARFGEVLGRMRDLTADASMLGILLREAWACIQVEQTRHLLGIEHCSAERLASEASVLRDNITVLLASRGLVAGALGFVYQDLMPGPHDARRFFNSMLVAKYGERHHV